MGTEEEGADPTADEVHGADSESNDNNNIQAAEAVIVDDDCVLGDFLAGITKALAAPLLPTPAKNAATPPVKNIADNSIARRSSRLIQDPNGASALELKAQEFLARGLGVLTDNDKFDEAARGLFAKMFQGLDPLYATAIMAIDKLVVMIKKKVQLNKKGKGKGKKNANPAAAKIVSNA